MDDMVQKYVPAKTPDEVRPATLARRMVVSMSMSGVIGWFG